MVRTEREQNIQHYGEAISYLKTMGINIWVWLDNEREQNGDWIIGLHIASYELRLWNWKPYQCLCGGKGAQMLLNHQSRE